MDEKDITPNIDEAALTLDDLVSKIMRQAALGSASLDGHVVPRPQLDESDPNPPA